MPSHAILGENRLAPGDEQRNRTTRGHLRGETRPDPTAKPNETRSVFLGDIRLERSPRIREKTVAPDATLGENRLEPDDEHPNRTTRGHLRDVYLSGSS